MWICTCCDQKKEWNSNSRYLIHILPDPQLDTETILSSPRCIRHLTLYVRLVKEKMGVQTGCLLLVQNITTQNLIFSINSHSLLSQKKQRADEPFSLFCRPSAPSEQPAGQVSQGWPVSLSVSSSHTVVARYLKVRILVQHAPRLSSLASIMTDNPTRVSTSKTEAWATRAGAKQYPPPKAPMGPAGGSKDCLEPWLLAYRRAKV